MARWEWQKKVWQPYFAPHFAQSAPYGREKCGKKSLPYFFFLFVARNGCHSFATKEEQKRTQTPLTMENNDDIIAFLLARDAILLFEALLNEVESDGKSNKPTTRRVFPRPNYKESTWWKMLEDGRCKTPGTREAKLFRGEDQKGVFDQCHTFCHTLSSLIMETFLSPRQKSMAKKVWQKAILSPAIPWRP